MKKYAIICRLLISFGCIVFLLANCDDTAKGPATPTVVRKKVLPPGDQGATVAKKRPGSARPPRTVAKSPAPEAKPVQVASPQPVEQPPAPAAKPEPKPILAQADTGAQAGEQAMPRPKNELSELPQPAATTATEAVSAENSANPTPVLAAVEGGMPLYNPAGKIDPFEPLFRDKPTQSNTKKKKRKTRQPRTPLERIDISQLKLVGIILASSGNRALVEESSGKGYVIKKGTYIGTNAGRVAEITKNVVIVEEEYEDVFGKMKVQTKEIKLPKPPGEL